MTRALFLHVETGHVHQTELNLGWPLEDVSAPHPYGDDDDLSKGQNAMVDIVALTWRRKRVHGLT